MIWEKYINWKRQNRVMKLQQKIAGLEAKIEIQVKHLQNPTGYYDFEVRMLQEWREQKAEMEMELKQLREKL